MKSAGQNPIGYRPAGRRYAPNESIRLQPDVSNPGPFEVKGPRLQSRGRQPEGAKGPFGA